MRTRSGMTPPDKKLNPKPTPKSMADLKGHFGVPKKNPLADTLLWKIHGYIYVYDASNKNTFQTLSSLIETIKEIEKSERRG